MMEMLITLISVALGSSGLSAIIVAILNHRWAAKKGTSTKLDALLEAQKVLMVDRVRDLGECYIIRGHITLDEKENLVEMYQAYKNLGGNAHLKTVMEELARLPVHGEEVKK